MSNADNQSWPTLHELREQQKSKRTQNAANQVEGPTVFVMLNEQFEALFFNLCSQARLEESECWEKVKRAQEAFNLHETCAVNAENAPWTLENQGACNSLVQKQIWCCQQQLALIDLNLRRAAELQQQFQAPEMSAPRIELQKIISSTCEGLSFGYQLVGGIRVLTSTEMFFRDRQRGGASRNRKPKTTEMEQLITIMVKLLHQSDPPKNGRAIRTELTERYKDRLLTIWSAWPFFSLSNEELTNHVSNAVRSLNLPAKKNSILFKRRMQTTMARPRPEKQSSNAYEAERFARECEARQCGISDALVQVLEGKFGELESRHKKIISKASPEQLGVWLRCVHDLENVDELLQITR